jgi:hypothetical protein
MHYKSGVAQSAGSPSNSAHVVKEAFSALVIA